jgi:hypothetical protein
MSDEALQNPVGASAVVDWLSLDDRQLLDQCEVHTYRASGPGGQKRNKTDSAVRLHHGPTGLIVTATESRSQHENKARAVKRLRQAIALQIRQPVERATFRRPAWFQDVLGPERRLDPSPKSGAYWHVIRLVMDVLEACAGSVADAANLLGVTTSRLVHFIESEPKMWEQANRIRERHGCKPLR